MKKILSMFLSLALVCTFVGCSSSGVSQEDYDALLAEITALKQEVEEIKNALKDAEKSNSEPDTSSNSNSNNNSNSSNNTSNNNTSDEAGSRKNPLKVGESFDGVYTEYDDYQYGMTITLLEVISGDEAWELIKAANQFNDPPGEGMQYIMAKFSVTYHTDIGGEDRPLELNSVDFSYSTSSYRIENLPRVVEPDPAFDIELYEGATGEGWIVFLATADEESPKAVFLDALWFDLK